MSETKVIEYDKVFESEDEKKAFVDECERSFNDQIINLAADLMEDEGLSFILLSGPTCSGKTTASGIIGKEMSSRGRTLYTVSIDDFYNYVDTSKPGWHNVDMESAETIDLQSLFDCVNSLLRGRTARIPIFDFPTRNRSGYRELSIAPGDLVMFEGIQALYPQVTSLFPNYCSRSIYISVSDDVNAYGHYFTSRQIRLTRRIVRDMFYRGTTPDIALDIWKNVELNEKKNIEPHKHNATAFINSLMLYEFNIMASYVGQLRGDNPEIEALRERYRGIPEISSEYIPHDSLYREFIK